MDDLLTMIGMEPPSTAADGEGALSVTAPEQPAPASPIPPTELTLMPAASSSAPMAQASGEHFMMWLKQGITSHKIIINDATALVHTVSDTRSEERRVGKEGGSKCRALWEQVI